MKRKVRLYIHYCVPMHIHARSNMEQSEAEQRYVLQRQASSNSNFRTAKLRNFRGHPRLRSELEQHLRAFRRFFAAPVQCLCHSKQQACTKADLRCQCNEIVATCLVCSDGAADRNAQRASGALRGSLDKHMCTYAYMRVRLRVAFSIFFTA